MESKTVYKSKIDWWVWVISVLLFVSVCAICLDSYWWLAAIYGGIIILLWVNLIWGCWYEIDNDDIIVYQFFRPHRFPISKIRDVKKTVGYLATAGMSCQRVSISFNDRSVMKSAMPLEISPKDRDAFISHLKRINPRIESK